MNVTVQASPVVASQSKVGLIFRAVLLETVRRRELHVLFLIMGMFLVGALVMRLIGVENAATATFLLNLGLSLAVLFAKIITLLTAVRQFPDELEQRTLYPLLAKPLSRGQYLLGKWAAAFATGVVTLVALLALAWLPVPKMESYSAGVFVQMLLLEIVSIGMVAALGILFSLLMPKLLGTVIVAVLVLLGGRLVAFAHSHTGQDAGGAAVRWVAGYLPDFSRLDLVLRYTDGLPPLGAVDLLARAFYAAAFIVFPLALSNWLLVRRPL